MNSEIEVVDLLKKSNKKGIRDIVIFAIMVVLSGWIGIGIENLLKAGMPEGSTPGMGIWLIIPLVTALILRICHKESIKRFGIRPRFRGNARWYLMSFFLFPVILILNLILGQLSGNVIVSVNGFTGIMDAFVTSFIAYFVKNIFEEFAWRGYLTERLCKINANDWIMYLLTTLVWWGWHIPYYLYLLPNDSVSGNREQLIFFLLIGIVGWIMIFTELYRITGSTWPCVVFHTALNSLAVVNDYVQLKDGAGIWLAYDTGVVSFIICIIIGLCMRTFRIRKQKTIV